jgi:hypothetical protein
MNRDAWTAYVERNGVIRPGPVALERPMAAMTNKYHAEPIHVDGVRFASKKEAARYLELTLMRKAGAIAELERQPVFPLHIMELYRSLAPMRISTVGVYRADFRYCDLRTGEIVTEDIKSEATKTEAYRLRKQIAEAVHGFTVREVDE